MVRLPDGEKNFEDMYNRLDSISACDRQTDKLTDILSRFSPRYAYASRGKNWTISVELSSKSDHIARRDAM